MTDTFKLKRVPSASPIDAWGPVQSLVDGERRAPHYRSL